MHSFKPDPKNTVILDLDGTICDCAHRVDYAKMSQWEEFHSRLKDDKPFEDVRRIVNQLAINMQIIAVTGRNERFRQPTLDWLDRHKVLCDELLMRPDDDFRTDVEMKLFLLEDYYGSKEEVLATVAVCLEDRDRVVEGFRNYGLPCWQVRMGDY